MGVRQHPLDQRILELLRPARIGGEDYRPAGSRNSWGPSTPAERTVAFTSSSVTRAWHRDAGRNSPQ